MRERMRSLVQPTSAVSGRPEKSTSRPCGVFSTSSRNSTHLHASVHCYATLLLGSAHACIPSSYDAAHVMQSCQSLGRCACAAEQCARTGSRAWAAHLAAMGGMPEYTFLRLSATTRSTRRPRTGTVNSASPSRVCRQLSPGTTSSIVSVHLMCAWERTACDAQLMSGSPSRTAAQHGSLQR